MGRPQALAVPKHGQQTVVLVVRMGIGLHERAGVGNFSQEKIERLLSAIDGVLVEVTADVDVSKVRAQVNRNLPVNEGTVSVVSQESSTTSTDGSTRPTTASSPPAKPCRK